MNYQELLKRISIEDKDILNVYQYGSRTYRCDRKDSDFDFQIVLANKSNEQFSDNLINVNFYTPTEFEERLNNHEISALECHFLHEDYIWKELLKYSFKLDLVKLRHALSAKSSNSWSKAHKKLTIEKDYDPHIGKKSLFHAFRIIHFGIQIAGEGKIYNYSECNDLFNEIMNTYDDWQTLFETYKTRYNKLCTEFRLLAPKL